MASRKREHWPEAGWLQNAPKGLFRCNPAGSCGLRDGKKREDYYLGINFIFFRDSFILWRKGIEGKMNSSLTHPTATTTNSPL